MRAWLVMVAIGTLIPVHVRGQDRLTSAAKYQVIDFDDELGYGDGSSTWSDKDGKLSVMGMDLRQLVALAYGVPQSRVSQNADKSNARFLITISYPDLHSETPAQHVHRRQEFLQNLLRDREGLRAHTTDLPEPVLVMSAARQGMKMRHGGSGVSTQGTEEGGPAGAMIFHQRVRGRGVTIAYLAEMLSADASEPVIDRTGLSGSYTFDLRWRLGPNGSRDTAAMIEAARQQLGLELVPETEPVLRVVVEGYTR